MNDVVLLAHSIKAIQTLIDICFKFEGENDIFYNETKPSAWLSGHGRIRNVYSPP